MGCYNKTCGLSNLHILAGSKVYVFILEQNNNHDRCYSTALWHPLLLPFYSTYDDYGSGEDSSGAGLSLIMDALRDNLIERELGDNEYHDIAVKRDVFDEKLFFKAVHEHRLQVDGVFGETDVDFVMFRADVVEDILDNWVQERYVGDGLSNSGEDNCYISFKFADVLADVPAYVSLITSKMAGRDELSILDNRLPRDKGNKVSWYVHHDGFNYSQLIRISTMLNQLAKAGEVDKLTELLVEHLKASYLDSFMSRCRKVWIPGCHEGSQAQDYDGYRALTKAINRAIDREVQEYELD